MELVTRMKKRGFAIVVFFIMTFAVLGITQEILKAKFVQDSTTIVDGFYAEQKNDIDVLFLGSSNCFCTVDPVVLYEEYGIAFYTVPSVRHYRYLFVVFERSTKETKAKSGCVRDELYSGTDCI